MIDLSFLTEAEQEAILKVLNRDAELKKSEDERVKSLQDVVHDENEFKYKSGQWFYDAKSKRHREKINGVDLVRASIRKRKKPATIAELSELNKDSSKRRWVNSVNQDLFIPPELYGVMEAPDEAEEDIMVKKQEGNQSSKKVGLTSTEKQDNLRNGTFSPPKARQNPFNSEGLQDETDYNNEAPSLNPENVKMNGTEKPKSDIMSSLAKYGVKLPYPEQSKSSLNAPKAQDGNKSQKEDMPTPVPKPRTFKVNGQPQDRSNSTLKRDDSLNGTGKPRGILKRRSSSSSTDSESIRIAQSVEPSKIVLAGSPILEAGQNNFFDEQDSTSDNTPDKLKQVRFSEKIQQRLPSPIPEPYSLREVGEYGILDPGLSVNGLDNGLEDHSDSEDSTLDRDSSATEMLMKILEQNAMLENQASVIEQPPSLENERNQVAPKKDWSKNDTLRLEASTDISIDPPSNNFSDKEPLYAVVNKTSSASSPSQAQDFDMDDALMEPRFHGQRGKTQNIYLNEKPLEFGKSFSGGGKVTFESSYPSKKHKESYSLSSEDLTPERARTSKSSPSNVVNKPVAIAQDGDDPVESVALWRQPFKLENQEPRQPSPELTKEQKADIKAKDSFGKTYSENLPTSKTASGENSKETEYKSIVLQNRYDAERKPLGLTANLVQNMSQPSKTSGELDSLHKNEGRKDLPRSLHFNVMSLKDRMNEMPREQMSNPSQFQSLKHFWNVEEKNMPGETTVTSPDKILMHVSSRNKPTRSDIRRRSSEIPADKVLLPNAPDSLSEEEQTSQKVASWLAQTPTVYVDGQMDQNEDQLSSGKDIVEHVQKSAIPKKSDFTNALKRREESLEAPKITETEKSKTNEIQIMSQGEPDLGYHKQTTITFSPISQNYIERRAPTADLKMTDRGFYGRVVQMSNKLSPAKETLSVEPKHEPYDKIMDKTLAPEKSPRESRIGFETLNGISDEELSLPKEESEAEEIIEKSAVPKSRDQQDFIFALKKLEIEASKQPPLPDFAVKDQGEIPKEEITQNTVTPVKSSFKIGFEQFSSPNATNELETSADQAEEIIEKSAVPKSRDQQDFIFALKKLEIEASKPPLPDFEVAYQDGLPKEEIKQNTVTPVKSSFKIDFDRSSSANDNVFEKPTDHSVKFQPQRSYASIKESGTEVPSYMEETIEKSTVPSKKDNEDLSIALRKLELEAIEHQSDEYVAGINQGIPEDPEDLLVDDTVKVSQFPNREVVISKKVYSSIESMPSIENFSESGKVKQVDYSWNKPKGVHDPKSHDYSYYEELANHPHSPEPSGSYTGNGNLPYKKPEVGSPEVSNSEPGKPALSESPSDTSSSKNDKYEFMVMKAQDESISKVLDWFSKSSEIEGNPPSPVGMLQPSKGTSSQILIQTGGNKKESGPNENNFKTLSEPTSYLESPNTAGEQKSSLSILGMQNGDNSDIPNVKLPATVSLVEDNGVPSGLIQFSSENRSPLQYGNRGGGSGKISNQEANTMQDNEQCREAKYLDISEVGKEGLGTEVPIVALKQDQIPVASEFMTNHQISEMVEKPHSRSSLSSTDTNNDQSDIENDELLTQANSIENASPPRVNNSNLESGNCLEFGKNGSGSGKTFSPSQVSEIKEPRLSVSSTDTKDDQFAIKNSEPLTQANSIENAFPSRVMHSNLEAGNCLEFDKNGSGSGKTSSPSQEISKIKKPRLSLSSTDTDDDQSGIKNDELLTQTSKENISPSRLINLNLEYGTSGGGSGKTSSPSQEISTFKKPRLSLSSTDTDDDQSGIKNDELLTQTSKENISPSRLINLNLEYGGGGSGKTSSPSQEISTFKKPRLSLSSTDTDDDQSGIKNDELLTQTSKENISPSRLINLNLEYGTSGGGSGKTSSPSQEISTFKKPRLSLSSTDTDDDQSGIKNDELLTQTSKENISPSRLINLNLEYGTSGGGSGKTSSPSQEISTFKKPRLSLSSTDTDDDQSGIKNDELLTQTSKENISPSRLINLNLEYGGGGSGKTSSPSQEISTFKKPRLSLSSTDTDDDQSGIKNDELLTQTSKENISPSRLINLNLEYGGGGSGKTSSPSQEISTFKKPRLSLSSTDTDDDQSGIKNDELLTQTSKENISPSRLINLNLEYGTSGGGSGKTSSPSQEISTFKKPRLSLSSTDTDDDQSGIKNDELLTQTSKENISPSRLINLNLEYGTSGGGSGKTSSPSQEISTFKKPRLSLSSTDTDDDQSGIKNDELLTQTSKENISPSRLINLNLEYGGGGSGKTSSPSQEISTFKKPRLSLSSTDTDDDQSGIKNDELLTQTSKENISPSRLINLNLEYGTSGGGSGKTSSPSQEISTFKKPRLSLSSTDTDDDQSGIKNDELLTQTSKENISPPRLINLNLEAENCLQYDKSGGGSDTPVSPNQEIPEVRKPSLLLSSTDSTDHDLSETGNVALLTPVQVMEEESVPPAKINPVENLLDLGKSKGGASKLSNQAADYMQTDPQLKEDKEVFDKGEEGLKGEKESDLLTDDPQIQRMVEAETLNMDTENRPLDGSRPENVDYIKILDVPPSHDTVKFNVPRRVSDIKQLWEGDKSALPAAKTILSSSKQMLGSREISITPQSSSIESDDQNSPSLVTFKRVMVEEEEENALLPVDQLKSFWENEKNKEVVLNAKQPDGSLVKNSSLDADEVSALAESRSKFKKRHTFHSFFENEQNSTGKNPPGRSVSLSESSNDNLKDRQKSTTFQNLRSFWNVDHKANPNDRTLSDTKNRQFRSNPDLSKESFVAKIKSKLESQSLEDIREDTPDTQVQPVKDVYNHKNKTPLLSTFIKQKSSDNSLRNSVEAQENVSVFQACNPIEITSVSEAQTKSKSSFEVSDHKEVSEVVVKSAQRPEKLNEFSLRLQKLRDEFSDKSLEGATSVNLEYKPNNDERANGDVENQNLTVNKNGERMLHKECERRQPLVKQIGLDDENSSVGAEAFHFLKNYERDNLKNDKAQVDNGKHVYETVERTLIPPPKHSADFDRGLQKLYNELLEVSPVSEVKPSQNEFMNMQSPEENFSKVLTVSSNKIKSNVQRSSSFQQPIVINLSSTKINVSNETTGKNGVNLDEDTETSIARECDLTPAEKEECKKEIVERIDMPKVVPRAPFNYFDEGLKKLYDESRDLTATKPVSGSLQALPAKQDLVMRESVTSVSQAPVILEQEIGETIGKASAPTKIYHAKSSEKDQKEEVNDEEEPFMGNVPSNHVTSEESQPRFSEHIVAEGTVSEMSPKGKEASVEENVQSLQYETIQESPSKTDSPFIEMRQSSPMKEKSSSLRKSTLELYLEVPYRREMSKSMDFELGGYIASDVDKDGCMDESNPILRALKRSEAKMLNSKAVEEVSPTSTNQLNSSSPTEDIPVNSFPQNAETLKRLSQSVPAFINDDTDGRDTDSASESSFQIGRHKKSPSSLTNLSGSSGMASMSSVSGSVMSIYSGDFGNVDIKGGIEFSMDYVEQLKEFLIYVYQCRELAVAEVKKQRSDPYVKAYLLPEKAKMGKRKTAVKKKTLNPVYNEILRYKIPKDSLLAQTLNLSVWHHDALGRNSFLGEVNVNLETWDWSNTQRKWYQLEPRTPAAGIGLENRGEMKLALKYVPMSTSGSGTKPNLTGEVHISIKDCLQLPMLRGNKINSFVKCTVLPDTSRKSRQRTRTVDKTPNPYFNHTMVYDGFKEEDLREACVELTVWDHNRLSNHFLGGLRIGLGTGKSYGTAVDWMDSTHEEATMWEKMMASPNTWVEGMLPLRMFKMAKLAK